MGRGAHARSDPEAQPWAQLVDTRAVMRVERGRGALVAVAEPEAAAGDAAQAFEQLGASLKGIP